MKRRAIFLDRDGTLVHPVHYPSCPEQLRLYDHIGSELYGLQQMGFRLIVVTNQSGIARGYFSEADLQQMHQHLARELAASDVYLSGIYYCPHHIDGIIPELAIQCACRKPEPGMLLRAAAELDLDLHRSWLVGDILDDIEAGNRAGCRTMLVDLGTEELPSQMKRCPTFVARDSCHALRMIQTIESLGSALELTYRPENWRYALSAPYAVRTCHNEAGSDSASATGSASSPMSGLALAQSQIAQSGADCSGEYVMEEDSCRIL
ncbi:MAG TPA: HAD family hydrolase [Ktedonosporobacter sp.]|jgi:D-glycero-D-manno-heptose 1,7-bisphosphate phosphatase|nr:HAD family hydrolase [Ktedonosporobacter sp.]